MWFGWGGVGATANFEDFLAVSDKNGPYLNGIGDWYAASETNNYLGYAAGETPTMLLGTSPNGDTLYVLTASYIFDDAVGAVEGTTFGVWACPITRDSKVPLIPIAGEVSMLWREGFRGPEGIRRAF